MDTKKKLSGKEQVFVDEYTGGENLFNATQSALKAGYSPNTAGQIGHNILKKPHIQSAIQSKFMERQAHTMTTVESITAELQMAFFLALQIKNPSGMIRASMAKAKIHGLLIENIRIPSLEEFMALSNEERLGRINEIIKSTDLTGIGATSGSPEPGKPTTKH
jgi:phage terminase small subunit